MLRNDVDKKWLYSKIKYYAENGDKEMALRFLESYAGKIKGIDRTKALEIIEGKQDKKKDKKENKSKGDE